MPAGGCLRVLVVLEYFPPHLGGVETLFAHLTERLVRHGHAVTVITARTDGAPAREARAGVDVRRLWVPRWARRTFFVFVALPFVIRAARRADIIHAATHPAAIPVCIAAGLTRTPAVLTVHEVYAELLRQAPGLHPLSALIYRLFEAIVLRLPFAQIICDSAFTRGRLLRRTHKDPARVSVVYPPVAYDFWDPARHRPADLKSHLGLSQEGFLYLYFGRPGYFKGVEYLIAAAGTVRRRVAASHLVMFLDRDPPGQYRRLTRQITERGLAGHVTILPPLPQVELPGALLAADCIVVPSLAEGFGYAAIEAATLGCPVVATAGHAVQEVVGDDVVLVPPRDAQALAEAIVHVARQPIRRPAPRRFDGDQHIAAIEAIYRRVTATDGSPAGM